MIPSGKESGMILTKKRLATKFLSSKTVPIVFLFRDGDFRPEKTAGMEVTKVRRGRAGRACGSSSRWVRIQLMVRPISALGTATHTHLSSKKGGFMYFFWILCQTSAADPGCLDRIPFRIFPSRIPDQKDSGSRIANPDLYKKFKYF
jgi:hypothetical protein